MKETSLKASLNPLATPVIAIIGRPNVGKSTLVNRILGKRQAIVDDQPGVTRDRAYFPSQWNGKDFILMDTGGLVPDGDGAFESEINQQVHIALQEAHVVVFLVDGKSGITSLDSQIAHQLRQHKKKVLLAVNKVDTFDDQPFIHEFHQLGLGQPVPVSALHGSGGVGDLLDTMVVEGYAELEKDCREEDSRLESSGIMRVALVGRPNVGKSSILNKLAGKERVIVSDIPGTTRDAVDWTVHWEGKPYTFVDTAGIRKKGRVDYGVELFSVDRSIRAVEESDVTVMLLNAEEGVTEQDKKIVEISHKAGNALVLVMNKWDLVEDKNTHSAQEFSKKIYSEMPHANFAPILFTSAKTGQRLHKIFEHIDKVFENNHRRVKTSLVNQLITEAVSFNPPPRIKNKTLNVLYSTQTSVAPPTFVLFVNNAKLMKDSYRRYLEHRLRANIDFEGAPIRILARTRGEKKD